PEQAKNRAGLSKNERHRLGGHARPRIPALVLLMNMPRGSSCAFKQGPQRCHCELPKGEKQSRLPALWPWITSSAAPPRDDGGAAGFPSRSSLQIIHRVVGVKSSRRARKVPQGRHGIPSLSRLWPGFTRA